MSHTAPTSDIGPNGTNGTNGPDGGHSRIVWIVRAAITAWLVACIVMAFRPSTESIESTVETVAATADAPATTEVKTVEYDCAAAMRSGRAPEQIGTDVVVAQDREPCGFRTSQRVVFYVDLAVGGLGLAATSRRLRGLVSRT